MGNANHTNSDRRLHGGEILKANCPELKRRPIQRPLTQLVPGGEDGRAQAGIVVGVGEGGEIVLQPAVSQVEHHQAAAHPQQQQEEDGHHHRRHVPGAALALGGVAGPCGEISTSVLPVRAGSREGAPPRSQGVFR